MSLATTSRPVLKSVASSATAANILVDNPNRKGLIIHNTDANPLLIRYGGTATTTDFTDRIATNTTWVMPQPIYTGAISGIWTVDGSGVALITEL